MMFGKVSDGTETEPDASAEAPVDGIETSLSTDDLFDVLGNDRRRYVLEVVIDQEGTVELDELVERVATKEYGKPAAELSRSEWKAVNTALKQRQLPKLEETGLIACDDEAGEVTSSEAFDDLDLYLEIVAGKGIPVSAVYLVLSILGGLLAAAAALDAYPATVPVPPDAYLVSALVGLFGLLSLSYLRTVRRRKVDPVGLVPAADVDAEPGADAREPSPLSVALPSAGVAGAVGGAGMWVILHYVMFLTPAIGAVYGIDRVFPTLAPHLVHSVLLAVPFALAVERTSLRTVTRTAGETAAVGALYGVVLWVVIGGIVLPNATPLAIETLVTVRGYGLLYLPLDGLAAHVVYGGLLGGVYGIARDIRLS